MTPAAPPGAFAAWGRMTERVRAEAGHFYAVGVGPGAPDLLTLRAARLIETADVIVVPCSERESDGHALRIIDELIARQEIVKQVYPMTRDARAALERWKEVAENVAEHCRLGRSVVQVTLGDPLIYSTSVYLIPQVAERLPAGCVHVVPGITAFQAVAGRFGEGLVIQEDRLVLMPATDMAAVEEALSRCETLVLYKVGRHVRALVELLRRKGLLHKACLAWYAEQDEREVLLTDLSDWRERETGYLATAIIRIGHRPWEAPAESAGRRLEAGAE